MPFVESTNTPTEDWEAYLGEQFRAMRIRADLEQLELAERTGVSVGAPKNLEGGKGSSVKTLIKVARALGRTDWLEALAPRRSSRGILRLMKSAPGKWQLAPAYDVTHACNPKGEWTYQYLMSVNGKFQGVTRADLEAAGDRFLVPGYGGSSIR